MAGLLRNVCADGRCAWSALPPDLHKPQLLAVLHQLLPHGLLCPDLLLTCVLLQLRAFVTAPGGAYKQELGQSPLLFRESSVSPDQEERIRRKDAIIQTRNAQVRAAVAVFMA